MIFLVGKLILKLIRKNNQATIARKTMKKNE